MADINALIAQGIRPVEIQDPLARAAKFATLQGAQQEQQLNALKMQEYQRGVEEQNALRDLLRSGVDLSTPEGQRRVLTTSPTAGQALIRGRVEAQKTETETQVKQSQLINEGLKRSQDLLNQINPNDPNAPAQYMAWHEANHKDPVLGPWLASRGVTADQSRARIMDAINRGPESFSELLMQSQLGTAKMREMMAPKFFAQELGGTKRVIQVPSQGGAATVVPGSEAAVTLTEAQKLQDKREQQRIRQEGQRIGLEGRRVAVAEENARRDADPAFQQRMAAARATGEAAAKGSIAAQQALPRAIDRAEESLRLIDDLVGKQEIKDTNGKVIQAATKPHPGFQNVVGATWLPGMRFVPGSDAAGFMSRFDQLKGQSFLEAFETLKGGGAITEKEGAKGTDAINRMSISTDEKEFIQAARELQDIIRKGVANAQRKAASAAPGGVPGAVPAPAAAGGVRFLGFE